MLEPFLVQVRVRGGFPDHLQLRVTSASTSTVTGLGSTTSMGPTERKQQSDHQMCNKRVPTKVKCIYIAPYKAIQCALQRQKAKSIRTKQKYNNYNYILCKRYKNKIVFNLYFKRLIDSAHRRPEKHFKAYLQCFGSFCTNFKIPFLVFKVYKSTCPCIRRPLKMLLFHELGMPRRVSGSSLLSVPQSKTTNMQ